MPNVTEKIESKTIFRTALQELLAEQNLFQLVLTYWRNIFRPDFNLYATLLVSVGLAIAVYPLDESKTIKLLNDFIPVGASFSVTTFGFLLTGISLVAAITRKDFFIHLSSCYRKDYRMTELKYMFVLFFYIISAFIFYIFLILLLFIFTPTFLVESILRLPFAFCLCDLSAYKVLYVFFGSYALYLCLLLKSLAWNLYRAYVDVILVELKDMK